MNKVLPQLPFPIVWWPVVAAVCLFTPDAALAQLPVIKGQSTTQSGMIYYDVNSAEDKRERIYCYTVCPDSASCIYVDFNLIRSDQATSSGSANGKKGSALPEKGVKFVRIHEGQGIDGPVIGEFGDVLGTHFFQSSTGCITLEFTRDARGLNAVWTAMWRGRRPEECIRPFETNPCANVQDICGPEFHENFHYFGRQSHSPTPPAGSCVDETRNATWLRFAIAKPGNLHFEILPDNGFDDFDWVLVEADSAHPDACPELPGVATRLACNNAAGRGQAGATGMDERGVSWNPGTTESPYCKPIAVEKGDIFFLYIDDWSRHSTGFTIRFNDVVMQCANPHKDFLHVDWNEELGKPKVDPRKAFSQYTRVLRIDLSEKANLALGESHLPPGWFVHGFNANVKQVGIAAGFCTDRGLIAALLNGLKLGRLSAYAAHDFQTPLHFGDLLELASRNRRDSTAAKWTDWWSPPVADLENFMQVVELVVDERFDKVSGVQKREIRYIRLLWTDRDGIAPDYNVAVFNYGDVRGLLDDIPLENRHNDVQRLSMRDFLESQMYQSLEVERPSKTITSPQQSKFTGAQQVELENFHWNH